ncbi:MAG: glycosyltransferase [Gammaproteobacteria bacterium]|nr:glycosyltransferase [Gammaproteobacteria bacterium]
MTDSLLFQICPNDHPPFLDICGVYQSAAQQIGRELITVFLSPAHGEIMPGALYLNCPTLRQTRSVARTFESLLTARGVPRQQAGLAICHRYRAYRAFRASGYTARRTVAIAHEFEFFARWRRRIDQRLFARDASFAGVSQPVVDELAGAVDDPLLMPNGIDLGRTEAARVERPQARAALKLNEESFTVGVVGRLHPKKQPQLALAGFAALAGDLPDAHLLFIGDGELEATLRDAAGSLSVSFAGFIPDAARYIRALDALVIPSGEREAFSMVALEAMAAGVPVIAGPTPGPHFVLGDVGYYFDTFAAADLAAAIKMVHADRGGNRERLARGLARAEQEFSVAAIAGRLQGLLA